MTILTRNRDDEQMDAIFAMPRLTWAQRLAWFVAGLIAAGVVVVGIATLVQAALAWVTP